ncbi:MAG: carboxylesterase/lipase family protein [Nibricoccus sp.]
MRRRHNIGSRRSTLSLTRFCPLSVVLFQFFFGTILTLNLSSAEAAADIVPRNEPLATTSSGPISGYIDQGINAFKGIPYGGDTALRRFKAPVPPDPWAEVRRCVEFGPMAVQPNGYHADRADRPAYQQSEDCLRLNVWTPALRDGKKRPVLVYFHGGAYNGGSVNSDLYDGVRLCKKGDVVVVTVNHRLNGFGYLFLADFGGPAYAESGNAGMLDLVLALKWVRDNITEFGGDPGCVTIFGQSGGGAKCATLMAMPAAHGLFHRVWTMSGQQITGRMRKNANDTARNFLQKLNLTPSEIGRLNTLSTEQLVTAMAGGSWTPVVDGKVLPRDPFAPDASPLSADIPMVMGNTHDETTNLIGGSNSALFTLTWETLPEALTKTIKQFMGELTPAAIVAEYRKLYPNYSPSDIFFAATTAARSWKSMVVECESRTRQGGAPTYVYYVDWPSPVDGGKWKAPHMIDIPLVFDNAAQDKLTKGFPEAQKLADQMSDALIAFARTGNPNTTSLPAWPRFDLDARPTMLFDTKVRVENDPRGAERKLFAPAVYVQPGT